MEFLSTEHTDPLWPLALTSRVPGPAEPPENDDVGEPIVDHPWVHEHMTKNEAEAVLSANDGLSDQGRHVVLHVVLFHLLRRLISIELFARVATLTV